MPNRVTYSFVGIDKFSAAASRVHQKFRGLRGEVGKLGDAAKRSGERLQKLSGSIRRAAAGATALGAGVAALATGMVRQASKFEDFRTDFETLTQSAEKGKRLFSDLAQFAARTPFQLEGIAESAKQLLAFGVPADQVTQKLGMLGDLAAGTGKPMGEFALIFGKIKAKGKLTGEELNSLAEKSVNLREALGRKFKLNAEQVEQAVSRGQVRFEAVQEVIREMTSEGGKFFGMMARRSETLSGRWSTLRDNISLASAEVGKVLVENLKLDQVLVKLTDRVQRFTEGFKRFAEANPRLLKLGLIVAGVTLVLGPLLFGLAAAVATFGLLATGISAALPVIGAVAVAFGPFLAVAGLVTAAAVLLWQNFDKIKLSFKFLVEDITQGLTSVVDAAREKASAVASFFKSGPIGAVLEFVGVVDSSTTSSSQTSIDVNLNAPRDAVRSVKSRTTGDAAGLDVGLNLQEAL